MYSKCIYAFLFCAVLRLLYMVETFVKNISFAFWWAKMYGNNNRFQTPILINQKHLLKIDCLSHFLSASFPQMKICTYFFNYMEFNQVISNRFKSGVRRRLIRVQTVCILFFSRDKPCKTVTANVCFSTFWHEENLRTL